MEVLGTKLGLLRHRETALWSKRSVLRKGEISQLETQFIRLSLAKKKSIRDLFTRLVLG